MIFIYLLVFLLYWVLIYDHKIRTNSQVHGTLFTCTVLNGFRILHCIALHRHRHCHCHSHSPEFNNHIKSERIKFVTLDPSLTYF